MIKRFCDLCGEEIGERPAGVRLLNTLGRIETKVHLGNGHTFMLEVVTGFDGTWNTGHFHPLCVVREIAKLNAGSA